MIVSFLEESGISLLVVLLLEHVGSGICMDAISCDVIVDGDIDNDGYVVVVVVVARRVRIIQMSVSQSDTTVL